MSDGAPGPDQPSSYLRYLPALYQEDPFLGRFLRIFEDILSPVQASVDVLPQQFDPRLASPPMLAFLAGWVHTRRPAGIPEERWRALVGEAVWLHRWRGTKRGLRRALELVLGTKVLIADCTEGMAVGPDASLGRNTALLERKARHFTVTLDASPDSVDMPLLQAIIEAYKPAGPRYTVAFASGTGGGAG